MEGWRNLGVALHAEVGQYVSGMQLAVAETKTWARSVVLAGEEAATSFRKVGLNLNAAKLDQIGSKLTRRVTLPLVAIGTIAMKMAYDFDGAMAHVASAAGVPVSQLGHLGDQVLDIARRTGAMPKDLANALVPITEAGYRGQQALDILTMAAEASKAGLGEVGDVANAVTAVLHAYAGTGLTAARAMDILTAAHQTGKLSVDQLGTSMGKVLPIAAHLGLGFDQVAGTLAFLSQNGSAQNAITGMTQIVQQLDKVSPTSAKKLEAVGWSVAKLKAEIADKGLIPALQELSGELGGVDKLKDALFTDKRAGAGIDALFGKDGGAAAAASIDKATNSSNAFVNVWRNYSATEKSKIEKSLASLAADGIELGHALLPVVATLVHGIADLADGFDRLPGPVKSSILVLALMAAATGPVIKGIIGIVKAIELMKLVKASEAFSAEGALGGLGKGALVAGAGIASFEITSHALNSMVKFHGDAEQLQADLIKLGKGGGSAKAIFDQFGGSVDSLAAKIRAANSDSIGGRLSKLGTGNFGGIIDVKQANSDLNALNDQLVAMVQGGHATEARKAFGDLALQLQATGLSSQEIGVQFAPFLTALHAAQPSAKATAAATRELAAATEIYAASLRHAQREGLAEWTSSKATFDVKRDEVTAQQAVTAALDDHSKAQAAAARNSPQMQAAHQAEIQAERQLASSQRDSVAAQKALNQARIDAVKNLRDLRNGLTDAALSERSAQFALLDAQQAIDNMPLDASDEDRAKAQLALEQARQGLLEAGQAKGDAATNLANGPIQNAENIAAAQQRVNDAVNAEADAHRGVADAARASRQAQIDADHAVKVAADKLHDAQLAYLDKLDAESVSHHQLSDAVIAGYQNLLREVGADSPLAKALQDRIDQMIEAKTRYDALAGDQRPTGQSLHHVQDEIRQLAALLGGSSGAALAKLGNITNVESLLTALLAFEGKHPDLASYLDPILGDAHNVTTKSAPRNFGGGGFAPRSTTRSAGAGLSDAAVLAAVERGLGRASSDHSTTRIYTSDAKRYYDEAVFRP